MVDISIKLTTPAPDAFEKHGRKIREEMLKTMRGKSSRELKKLFEDTVFGWSKKPHFTAKFGGGVNEMSLSVTVSGPAAETYALVNAGSPPHTIIPRRPGGILRFKPGYRASTSPGVLKSRRAYRSGAAVVARLVKHPGFEPREFDKTIREEYTPVFEKDMQDAINKASKQ